MIQEKYYRTISYLFAATDPEREKNSVVFIHGASFNKSSWVQLITELMDSCTCYAPDLPGHGNTAGKGFDTIDEYARFIITFIRLLKIDTPVICGLSMGGAIAQHLLIHYGDEIKAGILMNTGPFLAVSDMIYNAVKKRYSAYVNMIISFGTSDEGKDPDIEAQIRKMSECDQGVACRDFDACNGFNVLDELYTINVKVLIISGQDDRITPLKLSQLLHENIQHSSHVTISDSGHFPCIERPHKTASAITTFLDSVKQI